MGISINKEDMVIATPYIMYSSFVILGFRSSDANIEKNFFDIKTVKMFDSINAILYVLRFNSFKIATPFLQYRFQAAIHRLSFFSIEL